MKGVITAILCYILLKALFVPYRGSCWKTFPVDFSPAILVFCGTSKDM